MRMETLARLGYATKGVLYLIIGGLAVRYAMGEAGGKLTDGEGAVKVMQREAPFGSVLPWLVVAGLGAYALWRLVQAIWDPETTGRRRDTRRIAERVGYGVSGLAHAALAFAVARGHAGGRQRMLVELLHSTGGTLLVVIAGLAMVGAGGYELYAAITARFMRKLSLARLSAQQERVALRIGQVGLVAHGLVFGVIGWFLLRAAASGRSGQARGLGAALGEILARSGSHLVLGAVAVGLVGYALHMFFTARYLRIGWDA